MRFRILTALILCLLIQNAQAIRIISLSPYLTESLMLLGAKDELVGITSVSHKMFGLEKEVVGDTLNINIEKILSLKPDVILVTPMNKIGRIQKLNELGIDIEYFPMEKTFDECCGSFLRLARLVGREEKAHRIIKESQERLKAIKNMFEKTEVKRVFIEIGNTPLITAGSDCYLDELIRYAGGRNVADDLDKGFFRIVLEKVLELNPDYIVIISANGGNSLKKWRSFSFLKAVSSNDLVVLNPDIFSRPNPVSFVEAVSILARQIHPEDVFNEN